MSLLNILPIAGTALEAQTQKMNIISENLANADSIIVNELGESSPYIAKKVVFEIDDSLKTNFSGVRVAKIINDPTPCKMLYNPNDPMANSEGYVKQSNVNIISETINNISTARNYQANIEILNSVKSMIIKTLTIGQ